MAIIEYGPENPHGSGFVGLRVEVKKAGGKTFQQYFSFKGLDRSGIQAVREKANAIHAKECDDAARRREAHLLYKSSRCPASPVAGISVGVSKRQRRSPEIYINVYGTGPESDRARSIWKKTIASPKFDYFWFEKHWKEACRVLARHRGLKRTPSRWLQEQPSEHDIVEFLRAKCPGFQYECADKPTLLRTSLSA